MVVTPVYSPHQPASCLPCDCLTRGTGPDMYVRVFIDINKNVQFFPWKHWMQNLRGFNGVKHVVYVVWRLWQRCVRAVNQCGVIPRPLAAVCPVSVTSNLMVITSRHRAASRAEEPNNTSHNMFRHAVTCGNLTHDIMWNSCLCCLWNLSNTTARPCAGFEIAVKTL